jgi:hypothetical protein
LYIKSNKLFISNLISGQTRSAPASAAGTPERRSGSNYSSPVKSIPNKIKAKLKKIKIKPAFKVSIDS